MPVIEVNSTEEFDQQLTLAGSKLVVIDFTASWCGPCRNIAPKFLELSNTYLNVVFLKVDVDKLPNVAQAYSIEAMPTFVFVRNKQTVEKLRGADPASLEQKIATLSGGAGQDEGDAPAVKGYVSLNNLIANSGCECLNESEEHTLEHCLKSGGGYLESDCDEQLIIAVQFNQNIKLHSLKIHGPPDKGPKMVKVFINQPSGLDFDAADCREPTQLLTLEPCDLEEGAVINLRFVKFQNVSSVILFVKDNQEDGEVTQIDYLEFIGNPVSTTNMSDFKRIAGKAGEGH